MWWCIDMAMLDSYLNLITSQHRGKKKYMQMLEVMLSILDDVFEMVVYLDDVFDLDEAVGTQEDTLGVLVGAARILPFQPDRGISPVLDNESYRTLLKAKIAQNTWKGGIEDLKNTWEELFDSSIFIRDNQDMTMEVIVTNIEDQLTKNMIRQGLIVPRPQGVALNCYFMSSAVFGYDMETGVIRGYDHAPWMNTEDTVSFSYDMEDVGAGMQGYDMGYWT